MRPRHARLLYDSDRERHSVGARATVVMDRTLLYRSEPFSVDLIVHSGPDGMWFLHGQIVRERVGTPVTGARVRVASNCRHQHHFRPRRWREEG